MQVYLFLNPNILTGDPEMRQWVRTYQEGLSLQRVEAVLFDPSETLLPPHAIVHFFSSFDAETWHVLSQSGRKVVITPTLRRVNKKTRLESFGVKALQLFRSILQFKFSPEDETKFRKAGCHYLVATEEALQDLIREWRIPRKRITVMGENAQVASKIASAVYMGLS